MKRYNTCLEDFNIQIIENNLQAQQEKAQIFLMQHSADVIKPFNIKL